MTTRNTSAVAVDPAPTDLALGLADLAAQARSGAGPLLLVATDLVVHPEALADLADDPRPGTAVLVSWQMLPADVRVRAGRVLAVGTSHHPITDADAVFAGALRVAAADRPMAAEVADELSRLARRDRWAGDPLSYLALGLVRRGVRVGAVSLDPWVWSRSADDATQQALAGLGPDAVHRARLARAAKAEDGFVATFLSRPLARRLTPFALRLGLTPNQVTVASVVVGLGAAAAFAVGGTWAWVAGALLLQASLVVDCVDGDVARYRRMFTPAGAWLDASTDRLKEFACYGGLAWGSGEGRAAWLAAAVMLTLQTARHAVDYTFTAVKQLRESEVVTAPLDDPTHPPAPAERRRTGSPPAVVWLKKIAHLGIGERWLVLSVLAAAGRPVLALGALLVLGVLSLAYTSLGRILRARRWPPVVVSGREREIVAAQVDGGPLRRAAAGLVAGRAGGRERFLWTRPAALRVLEYAGHLGLTAALAGETPGAAVFALLLVVASHHYDDLYRVLNRLRPPSAASQRLGLGWPGRLAVVAVLVLVGGEAGVAALWALAVVLGMLFLVVEPWRVLREVRGGVPHDGPVQEATADG